MFVFPVLCVWRLCHEHKQSLTAAGHAPIMRRTHGYSGIALAPQVLPTTLNIGKNADASGACFFRRSEYKEESHVPIY